MSKPAYREITLASVLFGVLIGAVMNASITYAGLKIGFTITGSAIAAVLGFGVLRGILRKGTILETNITQTIASAVNVPCSGVIFTVPVLFLLGPGFAEKVALDAPEFWYLMLACVVGAILGCAFIIPVRKQMLDIDRLRFPSGTAVAAILKSPGAGSRKALVLVSGAVVGALIYLPVVLPELGGFGYGDLNWRLAAPAPADSGDADDVARFERERQNVDRDGDGDPDLVLEHGQIDVGRWLGLPGYLLLAIAITPLSFGAGYITGRPGLMVLAGGVLAYFVLNPAAYLLGYMPASLPQREAASFGYEAFNRPLGIGMLLGGALMGVLFALPAIRAALTSIAGAAKSGGGSDELGLKVLLVAIVVCFGLLYLAADLIGISAEGTGGWLEGLNPHLQNLIIALVGVVWIWFAGIIISQCTGMTDWSPISGMALITVVLVMALAGSVNVVGAVLIGATLCVAVTSAADMMTDLKTGHIVGAIPKRQQIVELLTVGIGPVVAMVTILLIHETAEIGSPNAPAPQAKALKAVVEGVQGEQMPYALYGTGAALGIALGLGSFPGLGVLVGLSMYLPIKFILPYGLGCLANMLAQRVKGKAWAEEWGVPFCAGLIVGEAILALIVNLLVLMVK